MPVNGVEELTNIHVYYNKPIIHPCRKPYFINKVLDCVKHSI